MCSTQERACAHLCPPAGGTLNKTKVGGRKKPTYLPSAFVGPRGNKANGTNKQTDDKTCFCCWFFWRWRICGRVPAQTCCKRLVFTLVSVSTTFPGAQESKAAFGAWLITSAPPEVWKNAASPLFFFYKGRQIILSAGASELLLLVFARPRQLGSIHSIYLQTPAGMNNLAG